MKTTGDSVCGSRRPSSNPGGERARRTRDGGDAGDRRHRSEGDRGIDPRPRRPCSRGLRRGYAAQWLHDVLECHAKRVVGCTFAAAGTAVRHAEPAVQLTPRT